MLAVGDNPNEFPAIALFGRSRLNVADSSLSTGPGGVPVQAVNGGDDLFQVLGLVDVGGVTLVDLSHSTGAVSVSYTHLDVYKRQALHTQ